MKAEPVPAEIAVAKRARRPRLRRAARSASAPTCWPQRASSSLTRRIVVLNLAGLVALLVGFLYLNQFRQGLIEARVQSLLTQGEIIAGAIAASATVETDTITIDPDRLLQMQAGETGRLGEEELSPLEFSINPERVAPLLRRLVTPTRHARAHLRPRGRAPPRFPLACSPAATSCASTCRRSPDDGRHAHRAGLDGDPEPLPRPKRPGAGGDRPGERQEPAGGAAGARAAGRRNVVPPQRAAARRSSRSPCRSSASAPCAACCCCRPRAATSTPSSPPSVSRCCRSSSSPRSS